ncbi:MAG: hypothetical protein M1838_005345 [Thelocarpon superellum]|nr:MAG: hypothetical protein M1838_005345 [Thelocarpon superellum]
MTKKQTSSTSPSPSTGTTAPSTGTASPPPDCPPDVDKLGRHTWTFLHTLSATYPERATSSQAREMSQFLALFSRLYPCWVCAEDLQAWMAKPENEARLQGRSEFGTWLCEAHNEVNRKLGKPEFDCTRLF